MLSSILDAFGLAHRQCTITSLQGGLIHKTWKICCDGNNFILQRVNDSVFKKPYDIADNIRQISNYLKERHPEYLFVVPIQSVSREDLVHDPKEGYFRLFPFVEGSHTLHTVNSPEQAYEAALQFGNFAQLLSGFNADRLHITIPGFHDLSWRYRQLQEAVRGGNSERVKKAKALIEDATRHASILFEYEQLVSRKILRKRVTHHDTKISNVLFDSREKGLCVIDLDTVMPGYFISDLGDMIRTYVSPANEEERDFTRIEVRGDIFRAIVDGYLSSMGHELTKEERGLMYYSGLFMTYMQAIRFLADYCNNDTYYEATYEDHNYIRAGNQMVLLDKIGEHIRLTPGLAI